MKAFSIKDRSLPGEGVLGYLLYYERSGRFCIELKEDLDEWEMPLLLSSFSVRGIYTVDFEWSRKWVAQRIVPQDRQNLGMILKEFGLKEYDMFSLLMIAKGRCAQDDCFLMPLNADEYPEDLRNRLRKKINDLVHVSGDRDIVLLKDDTSFRINRSALENSSEKMKRLLAYHNGLADLKVSPGGQGLEWDEEAVIPVSSLMPVLEPCRIGSADLAAFARNNLVSTGEASSMLHCSRQNINDLVRRGKLTPVREDGNNSMFLKRDIQERLQE